jgi:hypothetical protein
MQPLELVEACPVVDPLVVPPVDPAVEPVLAVVDPPVELPALAVVDSPVELPPVLVVEPPVEPVVVVVTVLTPLVPLPVVPAVAIVPAVVELVPVVLEVALVVADTPFAMHCPSLHASAAPQALPHCPQFRLSLCGSMHSALAPEPQSSSVPRQLTAHAPLPLQTLPCGHALPQLPQLWPSWDRFAQ